MNFSHEKNNHGYFARATHVSPKMTNEKVPEYLMLTRMQPQWIGLQSRALQILFCAVSNFIEKNKGATILVFRES